MSHSICDGNRDLSHAAEARITPSVEARFLICGSDSYIDFSHDGAGNSIYVANGSSNAVKQP